MVGTACGRWNDRQIVYMQVYDSQEAEPTSFQEATPDPSLEELTPLEEPAYAQDAAYQGQGFSGQAAEPYSSQQGAGLTSQAFSGTSNPAYEAAQPDAEAQLLQEAALAQSLEQVMGSGFPCLHAW